MRPQEDDEDDNEPGDFDDNEPVPTATSLSADPGERPLGIMVYRLIVISYFILLPSYFWYRWCARRPGHAARPQATASRLRALPRPPHQGLTAKARPPLRRLYTIEWDVPYRMYYQTTVCVAEMFGAICVMMLAVSRLPLHAAHACHRLSTDTP